MQSAHPANLFQSDASLGIGNRRAEKSKLKTGSPIYLGKRQNDTQELASGGSGADGGGQKVLAAVVDNERGAVWTAESAGVVRRVDLAGGNTTHLLVAHKAPVAALALWAVPGTQRALLFSAGWDKTIHVWDARPSLTPARPSPLVTIPDASTDFIKALHVYEGGDAADTPLVLLSGGSDKLIRIWDLQPLQEALKSTIEQHLPTPKAIGTFSEHTRAITCVTSLPAAPVGVRSSPPSARIFSSDSMGRIFQSSLTIDARAKLIVHRELRGPETTVSCMYAGWTRPESEEDDEGRREGPEPTAQVWAGSHDKTVRLFVLNGATTASPSANDSSSNGISLNRTSKIGPTLGAQPALSPRLILPHEDYVKSLLPLHLSMQLPLDPMDDSASKALVVTGCADEDVRVFRAADVYAQRAEDVGVQCVKRQEGHWHEVEFLGLWKGVVKVEDSPTQTQPQWHVVSAGLDGSVRRWELKRLLDPSEPSVRAPSPPKKDCTKRPSGMTSDEERELEELMSDGDDDD